MDRSWPRTHALIVPAAALLLLGAGDAARVPIREARWTDPPSLVEALTRTPRECLAWPVDDVRHRSVAIGRAAFRTPLLLGGQAARVGMSCATCHPNGRSNGRFRFPGVSGAPGTADVTSSLMSSHRGDHIDNPKPIPDLAGPASARKISRDPAHHALETFIHGLVVEEFDGRPPPADVLAGLADYVRALSPGACGGGDMPITLKDRLDEVDAAVTLAAGSDGPTRRLLLAAARSSLGAIDERFGLPRLEKDRALLRAADAELQAIRSGTGDLDQWERRWPERKRLLLADARHSLFNPALVRDLLDRAVPPIG